MSPPLGEIVLVRHAETEWSRAHRHTGRTDIPLAEEGRRAASGLAGMFDPEDYGLVLASPLRRAQETCRLSGLGDRAQAREDLAEWDYGDYDGLTTDEVHAARPGWNLWVDGCPGGESAADVGVRADRVIAELRGSQGRAIVFSHGHMLRVLGARWADLAPADGARLGLAPAAISVLGHEHGLPILARWNGRSPD